MFSTLKSRIFRARQERADEPDFNPVRRAGLKAILTAAVAGLFGAAVAKDASAQRSRGSRTWWQNGRSRSRSR